MSLLCNVQLLTQYMYLNKIELNFNDLNWIEYAVKAQTSLAPWSWFHGSRVTITRAHQCCIFQS